MKGATVQPSRQVSSSATLPLTALEFLQRPLAAQLATVNPNGSPHQTIMWFRYVEGGFLFTTTTDRIKFRNVQHDPRASLTIVDPASMWRWVIVNGIRSVDGRDPVAFYRGLAEHYLDPERFAEWQRRAVLERRTVLRLTPQRVRTMGFPEA
ncbi:MAG TPA: PPOX class F420-dependent oxidoreductase [Candidatus Bathyarchaeia archaeon]